MLITQETDLANVHSGEQLRTLLAGPDGQLLADEVFGKCVYLLVYSRHHWLKFKGDYRVRADLRAIVDDLQARPPQTWDTDEADLLLGFYALSQAAIGLEQLRDVITAAEVRQVLEARMTSYLSALGQTPKNLGALPTVTLARRLSDLRPQVEQFYYRYSNIDGQAWYRTEGLIPRTAVDTGTAPDPLAVLLAPSAGQEQVRAATRETLAEHGESAPLLRSIMKAAVEDPALRVDHATITCVRGYLLDSPGLMTGSEAIFTETYLDPDLDLSAFGEQIGHESGSRLKMTVRARMLKLKRRAAANYYGEGCLHGQFVEKAADYMIFNKEDTHYRGHRSVGCSTGGRAAYPVQYQLEGTDHELPPMMGDFRVVRLSHAEEDLFTEADLVHVIRYAAFIRAVVEETLRSGGVVVRSATGGLDLHGKDGRRNAMDGAAG